VSSSHHPLQHSGAVDRDELATALVQHGLRLTRPELDVIFRQLDTDGSGEIDLPEFMAHFKQERAKRFDGHIPELKDAKRSVLSRLRYEQQQQQQQQQQQAAKVDDDELPPATAAGWEMLVQLEQLQNMQGLSPAKVRELRQHVANIAAMSDDLEGMHELRREVTALTKHTRSLAKQRQPPRVPQPGGARMGPRPRDRTCATHLRQLSVSLSLCLSLSLSLSLSVCVCVCLCLPFV
jgi:signal transduction histidine kinase